MAAMLYSLIRVVLDAIATSRSNEAKAFGLPRPAARQFDGQAPLLEDARG